MTIDASDPIDTSGDSLDVTQVCWTMEGENADRSTETLGGSDTDFSDGDSLGLSTEANVGGDIEADFGEWDFTPQHDIDANNVGFWVRDWDGDDADGTPGIEWYLTDPDGGETTINGLVRESGITLSWTDIGDGDYPVGNGYSGGDLTAGETYTLGVRVTDSDGVAGQYEYYVDVVAPFDKRFESVLNFDNSVHQDNGYLDGPEFFPDVVPVQLTTTETRRDVTQADATITTNTTDANQYVELRIGGASFDRTNNSTTASTTGGPARSIDVNLGLTRYPDDTNPQSATPRFGYNGQSVDDYELTANPDAISTSSLGTAEVDAVVPPGSIVGDTLKEAAELDTNGDALTRAIYAQFSVLSGMEIRSSEKVEFNNDE